MVDDDRDIAEVVQTVLLDEGFRVACFYEPTKSDVLAAIERLEPDCVLPDGGAPPTYGPSWDIVRWLSERPSPIPAIMLGGHTADREEAMLDEKGDDYFSMIHMQWGEGTRRVFAQSPDPYRDITAAS